MREFLDLVLMAIAFEFTNFFKTEFFFALLLTIRFGKSSGTLSKLLFIREEF